MTYDIELSEIALDGIKQLKKSGELQALKKLNSLLTELEEHPKTGTGKPGFNLPLLKAAYTASASSQTPPENIWRNKSDWKSLPYTSLRQR